MSKKFLTQEEESEEEEYGIGVKNKLSSHDLFRTFSIFHYNI